MTDSDKKRLAEIRRTVKMEIFVPLGEVGWLLSQLSDAERENEKMRSILRHALDCGYLPIMTAQEAEEALEGGEEKG